MRQENIKVQIFESNVSVYIVDSLELKEREIESGSETRVLWEDMKSFSVSPETLFCVFSSTFTTGGLFIIGNEAS